MQARISPNQHTVHKQGITTAQTFTNNYLSNPCLTIISAYFHTRRKLVSPAYDTEDFNRCRPRHF